MINVVKSFLPPLAEYDEYLQKIWDNCYLTNQGPLLQELEEKLKSFLDVKNFHFVCNGTIAIQLALNALNITDGEIITTPFSFVATTTAILWERCVPVFVDIEKDNYCIDVSKIEEKITPKTKAILAVHVFGYPCDIEGIKEIADKYNLKVIYDAAHAFGSIYNNKSLLSYGDISTCSFHATKLYHTIEGGGCIVNDEVANYKLDKIKRFGFIGENYEFAGINAKNSEVNAAMGLANFKYIGDIISKRMKIINLYDQQLNGLITRPKYNDNFKFNGGYYPVLFNSEEELLFVFSELKKHEIFPRRYFYPVLNKLSYLENKMECPIAEDISVRVACLPLYPELTEEEILLITRIIIKSLDTFRIINSKNK